MMEPAATQTARIPALDIARTVALVGMVVFHVTLDLAMFGHLPANITFTGPWPAFARLVAGSFLFLAGVSLWLAHGRGLRWPAFWRRFAVIAAAAAAVSVGTYVGMGQAWVRFGILHCIALGSLVALPTLRLPPLVTLMIAAAVVAAPSFLAYPAFNPPWLLWTGLATEMSWAVDYVPLLPWLAPMLAGIAAARLMAPLWPRLRDPSPSHVVRLLGWPGRHSLAIYLAHQPLIFALLYAVG